MDIFVGQTFTNLTSEEFATLNKRANAKGLMARVTLIQNAQGPVEDRRVSGYWKLKKEMN
jgi:hypothetical protein